MISPNSPPAPFRHRILAFLAIGLAVVPIVPPVLAWQPRGSRIVLEVPKGYSPASRFSGHVDEARGISIMIVEFPAAAYDEMAKGMTPEVLARQQILEPKIGRLERGGEHFYVTGEQSTGGAAFAKFILILREGDTTAVITANVPKKVLASGAATAAEIEAILKSARVAGSPAAEKPLFDLGYLGPFKSAGAMGGAATLYSLDGLLTPPKPDPARPLFLVAPSLDERPVGDLEAFSRRALETIRGYTDLSITAIRALTITDMRAVEATATAKVSRDSTDVWLIQTIVSPPSGGYVRMIGQAVADDWERLLPEFRKMAASYRPAP
jgi:hypothetical protein